MDLLREFLGNYREEFRKNLLRFSEGHIRDRKKLERVEDTLFEAFIKKDISKDFFYHLAYDFAKNGENVKTPLLKTLMLTVRDFIDFLIKHEKIEEGVNFLKRILDIIEFTTEIIDKAYQDYYQVLREISERKKEEEEKKFLLKEFELVNLKKEEVNLIFSYKELPIYCKGIIKKVREDKVEIELVGRCLITPVISAGDIFWLKSPSVSKPVKLEVLGLKNSTLFAGIISYDDLFLEKRQYVRVIPEKPIPVYIRSYNVNVVGEMIDISVGGIGVFLKENAVDKGLVAELEFKLKEESIKTLGECRYVIRWKDGYRAGFKFIDLSKEYENKISEYVFERQREILRELRALT